MGTPIDEHWPFADPPNVAVFTVKQIIREGKPILYVEHDKDDGAWQFLTGDVVRTEDGAVVGLDCMVRLDPSIRALADLPLGWRAWRECADAKWQRAPATQGGE